MSFDRIRFDERLGFDIDERLREEEVDELTDVVNDQIEIRERQITDLQQELVDVRSEFDVLRGRNEKLQERQVELQDEVERLRVERIPLRPREVFSAFGDAVDEARDALEERDVEIDDIKVNLKTNVVSTDEGIRFHLPKLDERIDAQMLSVFDFRVHERADVVELDEFEEVPELLGMRHEEAERVIEQHGFAVGVVEFEVGEPAGVVRDQFPSPYSVAAPDTTIDLVVSQESEPVPPTESNTGEPTSGDINEEPGIPLEAIDGIGPKYSATLHEAGVTSVSELADLEPEELVEISGFSRRFVDSWKAQANEMAARRADESKESGESDE